MNWHFLEGEAGCRFAVERQCVAVVVDALRASATAAMLFHAGASGILAVREVEEAWSAKHRDPQSLLFGERGGLPPEGFNGGNSPRNLGDLRGKCIIFTTTTGAGRLVSCWGAPAMYMGTTINASAVALAAATHGRDVAVIAAGLTGDPDFDAQEDRAAAAAILMEAEAQADFALGEGAEAYAHWRERIEAEGLPALFDTAPHAAKLRAVGLEADIAFCAQSNLTHSVPQGVGREPEGILLVDASWGEDL